ncbi:hypothetical protein, partial [Burkholderia sp. S171]|uniref:hypothetical protein n=1 Tax=Burkholderia sp. S171 TaxID=1641860 RepID=UPI0020B11526
FGIAKTADPNVAIWQVDTMFVQFIDKLLDDQVHTFTFQVAMPKLRNCGDCPAGTGVLASDCR